MELTKDKIYKTKDNLYIQIKEITFFCDDEMTICNIVTGGSTEYKSDAKTNVERKVWTKHEFLDLIKPEDDWCLKKNAIMIPYSIKPLNIGGICQMVEGHTYAYREEDIDTLKQKILQDFADLDCVVENNICYANYDQIEEILDKRIGREK